MDISVFFTFIYFSFASDYLLFVCLKCHMGILWGMFHWFLCTSHTKQSVNKALRANIMHIKIEHQSNLYNLSLFFSSCPHYTNVMCGGEQPVREVRSWSSWAWWLCMLKIWHRDILFEGHLSWLSTSGGLCHTRGIWRRMTARARRDIISHHHYNIRRFSLINDRDESGDGEEGFY